MTGCFPTSACTCKCHISQNECCIHCIPASVDMIHSMRYTIETWQKGYEILVNGLELKIKNHDKLISELIDKITKIANYYYKDKNTPFKCPVCEGANLLYKCSSCEGTGIVWK